MTDIIICKEELEDIIRILEKEFPELKQWATLKSFKAEYNLEVPE